MNSNPIPIPLPLRGLIRAVDREQIPAGGCAEVENWIPRDEDFRVRPGLTVFGQDINQRPCNYVQYDHNDLSIKTALGTNLSWWRYDAGTNQWVDLSGGVPLTTAVEQIAFRTFPKSGVTWLLGVNGKDANKKWDGTSAAYVNWGGSPPIARCMMKLFDRIILGNLKSGGNAHPSSIDVSNNKDFDTGWGTVQVGPLTDCDGEIIAMEDFGSNGGAIYASDGVHLAIAQGGAEPFRFELKQRLQRDEGPASTLSVTRNAEGSHIYLASDGTVKHFNSVTLLDWGPRDLHAYIKDTINFTTITRSWAAYDPTNEEILFVYPEQGNLEPNAGVIIKERTGAFWPIRWTGKNLTAGNFLKIERPLTLGDLTVPLGSISQTLSELSSATVRNFILGETGGQSYEGSGTTDDGVAINAFVETGLNSLGMGTQNKTINEIEHRFSKTVGSQQLTIKIGKSKSGEPRTLSNGKAIDIGNPGPYTTGHRITSKFLSMRLDVAATKQVVWKGSLVDAVPRGFR